MTRATSLRRLALIPCALALTACAGDEPAPGDAIADTGAQDTAVSSDTAETPDAVAADAATADAATDDAATDDAASPAEPTPVCVAIRGNGELITAHFAALARIAETFGPFEGVAGGSSASITSFLTESMHMHPLLWRCGEATCSRAAAGARLGLMFKSLYGYLAAMGERDEAVAVGRILGVIALAQEEGIGELIAQDKLSEAWSALVTLFESPDVRALINPELISLLADSPDIGFHVREVWDMLSGFGSFTAGDPTIFVRPGIVNFAGLASEVGRIGSFYAGYGEVDEAGWAAFFDACAEAGVGLLWPEVAALEVGGETCGARFSALLGPWRDAFIPVEATADNRIDDRVGAGELRTLAITSVLTGPAATAFAEAWANYQEARPWSLEVAFVHVMTGYWGKASDVAGVVGNGHGYADLKTSKAMSLGQATWREALSLSPAEPGLARAQALDAGRVSAGGWPDLEPVLALKNAGCERVLYLTRQSAASGFGRGVAQLLGASAADDAALYDLGSPTSSFSLSLTEADGVWCTDWNAFGATDLAGLMADAHEAPFEVRGDALVPAGPPYPHTTASAGLVGCTPGVTD